MTVLPQFSAWLRKTALPTIFYHNCDICEWQKKQLGKNNWLDIRIFGKLNICTGAGHWRCQAGPVTDSLRSWDGPAQLGKLGGPPGTDSDAAGRLCAPKDKAALLPVPGPA